MAKKKMFARGYEAQREEKKRQEIAQENFGKKLWKFYLNEEEGEAEVHFLNEEPVNYYEHNIKTVQNGKTRYEKYTCTQDDKCTLCKEGNKASFKSAYLIVDHREFEYTDGKGKKQTGSDRVRLYTAGTKVASQLDRISSRYGLTNRLLTIVRTGSDTQTNYIIEKGDKEKLTSADITEFLPENLREDFDGTADSIMDIIEEQLLMLTYEGDSAKESDDEEDEEEEDDTPKKKSKAKRSRRHEEDEDDDDDDEEVEGVMSVEDDDEEEEERPRKKVAKSVGSRKKMFKKK